MMELLRVKQWYKNLLVFLPLLFAQRILELDSLLLTVVGFFALGLVSSSGYILNDLVDRKRDRAHPEKSRRPIASGKVPLWQALLVMMVLLLAGFGLAAALSYAFFLLTAALFALMLIYTFWGRNEMFVDILLVSVNYIVRAVAGAFVVAEGFKPYIPISPWLILCPFFLALFLSSAKRRSDMLLLGTDNSHRKMDYSPSITQALMVISTSLLVMSYGFYTFLAEHTALLLTLPFALYTIFRYYALVESGSPIGRHPELSYKDIRLVTGIILWMLFTVLILY